MMRILLFIVHPSKYHLFKHPIAELERRGHQIDVAIITKDVLEPLVKNAGWHYTNIFPEGRRSPKGSSLLRTLVNALKTVWRLHRLTSNKRYDLFITDDLLVVTGWLRSTPILFFQDDDLSAVPETGLLMALATKIVCPRCSDMGRYEPKTIKYRGNHEIAYLHPKYFTPDYSVIRKFNPDGQKYTIVRLVSLTATHDKGKSGLTNNQVTSLIDLLGLHGKVFITSERPLAKEFERHRIAIDPNYIAHALYYADLFIGDSQTMTSEAAVLGTPSLRYNDFVGKISYLEEEEHVYGLTYGFKSGEFNRLIEKADQLLNNRHLKAEWSVKRQRLLDDYVDVPAFIINVILGFEPHVVDETA